jgi:hypothetical protein
MLRKFGDLAASAERYDLERFFSAIMPQRFIVCTDSAGPEEYRADAEYRDRITRHLEASGCKILHWFGDLWLAVDASNKMSPALLEQQINSFSGKEKHILVMKVDGSITYSGFGPKDGWLWMAENLGQPQSIR